MTTVFERTPAMEKAASYSYGDFLKDVVQKTVADTTRGFKRPRDFSDEEIMGMAFAGVGGGTKILKEAAGGGRLLELLGKGTSKEGMWKMPVTRPHLATAEEIPKEAAAIIEKYKNEKLTYDAFFDPFPGEPQFASHQWTFRGKSGSLRGDTLMTKGTSLDEFEAKVASKIREYYGDLSTTWKPGIRND
jgi:hypothetical protein